MQITRAKVLRRLRSLWCPLVNPARDLPYRHWRWMWLAVAARPLIFLMVAVLVVPYELARVLMWLIDLGGNAARINTFCLKRDLARTGWKPPGAPRVKIRLRSDIRERTP